MRPDPGAGGGGGFSLRAWWIAAVVGIVAAIAFELATRTLLAHRTSHAIGFGLGVAIFHLVRVRLTPAPFRGSVHDTLMVAAVMFVVVFVASWVLESGR